MRRIREWWYMVFKERYFIVKEIGDEKGIVQSEWYCHPLVNSWNNTGWQWKLKPYYHYPYIMAFLQVKKFQREEKMENISYYLTTVGDYFFINGVTNPPAA